MPELPEVETIRRSLAEKLPGYKIEKMLVYHPGSVLNPHHFNVSGARFVNFRRRGKYLLIDLDQAGKPLLMVVHLRMTGKLLYADKEEKPDKHTHIRFYLTSAGGLDKAILDFNDVRKFGRIEFLDPSEESRHKGLIKLGPEPLGNDWQFDDFWQLAQRRPNSYIKNFILDQSVVTGIGNIYADESLFRAGILPKTKLKNISKKRLKNLYSVIPQVLEQAIGFRGTSFRDYVDSFGNKGHFQLELKVYHREGQACRNCGATILKSKLAGRGTHYCPKCQK